MLKFQLASFAFLAITLSSPDLRLAVSDIDLSSGEVTCSYFNHHLDYVERLVTMRQWLDPAPIVHHVNPDFVEEGVKRTTRYCLAFPDAKIAHIPDEVFYLSSGQTKGQDTDQIYVGSILER